MPSTSKTNRRNFKKPIPKPKQEWRVKQPTRDWLELPLDVTANILSRIGVVDILENAQKVCTTWHKICKDPAMWRVIKMKNHLAFAKPLLQKMCMRAVDLSEGQLVDICIEELGCDELLLHIAARSSKLKRLQVACCYGEMYDVWPDALKKFPLLEELNFYITDVPKEAIEAVGRYCPLLKTLKVNQRAYRRWDMDSDDESKTMYNEMAVAIGKNLPELRHLELINDDMSNIGLHVILDGCRHLQSLDLRGCLQIALKEDIGKKLDNIKKIRLPKDSLQDFPYIANDVIRNNSRFFPDEPDGYFSDYISLAYDDDDEDIMSYDDEFEDDDEPIYTDWW